MYIAIVYTLKNLESRKFAVTDKTMFMAKHMGPMSKSLMRFIKEFLPILQRTPSAITPMYRALSCILLRRC